MLENPFTTIKDIFIDGINQGDYVKLDKSVVAYKKICSALDKPLKIILFYGKPGSGKTFLLQQIYTDLKSKKDILLFLQPFFNESDFTKAICEFFGIEALSNIDELLSYCRANISINASNNTPQRQVILMLDESQLYPTELIEKIRLMADTRYFKILFTIHKTEKEDVIAKDYFKTRIWESIEFEPCTFDEVSMYVEKKLAFHNKSSFFSLFNKQHLKALWQYSAGNLRVLNKLLYKTYELLEYYEENKPSRNSSPKTIKKVIEMAAIDSGILHA